MRLARAIAVAAASSLTLVGLVAVAPAAQAKPLNPGTWKRVSTGPVSSINQPGLVRFGAGLHVVYRQDDTNSVQSIRSRGLALDGTLSPVRTVVANWASVVTDPAPFVSKGKLHVAFGGIRSTNPGEKYSGAMAYATSTNGATYTLAPDALTNTKYAYGSYGTAALDDAGTPFVGVVAASSSYVTLHRGTDGSFPATTADRKTSNTGGCCAYDAALARDTRSGAIYAAWHSNSTAKPGIWAQRVAPGGNGPLLRAPGSLTGGSYIAPSQRVAMVARAGGGVYLAYTLGYPSPQKVRIWKFGSSSYTDIRTPNVSKVALGQGTGGRLWMAWSDGHNNVTGHRSSPAATRWASGSTIKIPGAAQYGSLWKLAVNGTRGPLEVVINADIPGSAPGSAFYYSQIWSPLELKLSKKSVSSATGGRIVLTVTSAGVPVPNARVVLGTSTFRTSSTGKVTFRIRAGAKPGVRTVKVSLLYYVSKSVRFRVT